MKVMSISVGAGRLGGILMLALFLWCVPQACTSSSGPSGDEISYPVRDFSTLNISTGIAGHIWYWEGNFMPGEAKGTVTAVSRWVIVYPLVPGNDRTSTYPGGFFSEVRATPLDSVMSDSTGFYQIALGHGSYSIFVRESGMLYFNGTNDVQVYPDSVRRIHIDIDYKAAY